MKRTIAGLVCLNLGLASLLVYARHHRAPPPLIAKDQAPSLSLTPAEGSKGVLPSPKPGGSRRVESADPEKFSWQALVSSDMHRYVDNLRAVQCPEETIRDIIVAEVNRQFSPREAMLKARPEDRQPWEVAVAAERRSNESKLRQLLLEKRALLRDLVGVDVHIETPPTLAGRNIEKFESAYQEMPEEKRELVRSIQEKYWGASDDIKGRTMGFLEPEDRDEYARIKRERREELSKVLSPRELEDYEIKTSATANALRSRLSAFEPTDEEFRKIFNLTQPLDDSYSLITGTRDAEDKVAESTRKQVEQQLQNEVRAVLGEERYAELERSRDPAYRSIVQAADKAGVPRDSALQAYESQKAMRDELGRVLSDPNLSAEERRQTALAMQAEAEQQLQGILGEEAFQKMRRKIPGAQLKEAALQQRLQTIVVPPPAP